MKCLNSLCILSELSFTPSKEEWNKMRYFLLTWIEQPPKTEPAFKNLPSETVVLTYSTHKCRLLCSIRGLWNQILHFYKHPQVMDSI